MLLSNNKTRLPTISVAVSTITHDIAVKSIALAGELFHSLYVMYTCTKVSIEVMTEITITKDDFDRGIIELVLEDT